MSDVPRQVSTPIDEALVRYVADFGPPVPADANRVRGALTDLLADNARAHRGDVDAAAIAVEEGIVGRDVASGPARDDAVRALTDRGLSVEMAAATVDRWSAALGTADLTVTAPVVTTPKRQDDRTVLPLAPAPPRAATPVLSRRRLALIAGVILAALAIAGGALALAGGGGDGDVLAQDASDTTTTAVQSSTTDVTTTAPTTTAAPTTAAPETVPPETTPTEPPATTAKPKPTPTEPPATPAPTAAPPPPPTPAPTLPPTPAPVAVGESYRWSPVWDGAWYEARLTVTSNDSGEWTNIEWSALDNGHVALRWDGHDLYAQPHHNGYFVEGFSYRLLNNGVPSAWVRVNLTVDCNTTYACY